MCYEISPPAHLGCKRGCLARAGLRLTGQAPQNIDGFQSPKTWAYAGYYCIGSQGSVVRPEMMSISSQYATQVGQALSSQLQLLDLADFLYS
jgi:hypothetical protein